ncbi:MAG: lamin tail domain-containing protein [Candidatus Krumholzibacteriota bacterium]|nr:lamin tail domain-containing protein [Candidatus Krumholzibacteriota bacterium]
MPRSLATACLFALLMALAAGAPRAADPAAGRRPPPPADALPLAFADVAALEDSLAADSALAGRRVSVAARLAADLFRDVYLVSPGGGPGRGLHVTTGEHLAEVGQWVRVTGQLLVEGGEPVVKAEPDGIDGPWREGFPPAPDGAPLFAELATAPVTAGDLLAAPGDWHGMLVRLDRDLRVERILRDANGVPWLAVVSDETRAVDVELSDGQHPVLREGGHIDALAGVWRLVGDRWRLSPRHAGDWTADDDCLSIAPPARRLAGSAQRVERKPSRGAPLYGRRRLARPLLDAVCYDPAGAGEAEGAESFAVVNDGERTLHLDGWSVTDHEGRWFFPAGAALRRGGSLRVARDAERFWFEFGLAADYVLGGRPAPADTTLVLCNAGDELVLLDQQGRVADAVAWGDRRADQPGWTGAGALPYRFSEYVPAEGQVLWRKRDPRTGRLVDTDTAADWIGDPDDPAWGRRLAFPGWDRLRFADTARCAAEAEVTAFVSPDNSFLGVQGFLRSATESLELSLYLFTHPLLAEELLAALDRGVRVTLLLDGEVYGARGGTYDSVRAIATRIDAHPSGRGRVYLWRNGDDARHLGPDADIPDRYNHCHQKFVIADRARVLVSSDNLTQGCLPADDPGDGTSGSRGAFLVTDAPCVVERLVAVWEADCDPARHRDIRRHVPREALRESWPSESGNRTGYLPVQAAPYSRREKARFELTQSPDNALRPDRGYLGLVNRAGAGDLILVEQQYEREHWGYGERVTPNPRLEAYLAAARRGARVRILLSGAGVSVKNRWARERVNARAAADGLDLRVELAVLPRSGGRAEPVHNKMLLARLGGERWSHVGSANGSETAQRFNREVGLSIESAGLYAYLEAVFAADWRHAAGEALDAD